MRPLSRREQRLAAFAILFGVIALAWNTVFLPVIDGFADRQEARAGISAQYSLNDRVLAGGKGWRMAMKQQLGNKAKFAVLAPTRAVGVEKISSRVAQSARAAGGTLLAAQEVKTNISPEWIGVRCDLRLTLGQLNEVLKQLQSEEPYVVVDYLSISSSGDVQPGEPDSLAIRMDVSAPFRVEKPPQGRGNTTLL